MRYSKENSTHTGQIGRVMELVRIKKVVPIPWFASQMLTGDLAQSKGKEMTSK